MYIYVIYYGDYQQHCIPIEQSLCKQNIKKNSNHIFTLCSQLSEPMNLQTAPTTVG